MKVLMFGWEFPPKIYGGLAVASYGITKAERGPEQFLPVCCALIPRAAIARR